MSTAPENQMRCRDVPPLPVEPDWLNALEGAVLGLMQGKGSVFLSTLYCHLHVTWTRLIPTAGTDGEYLLINPDFFMPLSKPMRVTLMAHELWHCGFLHMERRDSDDPEIHNMAADHAINLMLEEHGYLFDIPALKDPRFTGMSTEQIYNILYTEKCTIDLPFGSDVIPVCAPAQSGGSDGPDGPGNTAPGLSPAQQNVIRAATIASMSTDKNAGFLPGELSTLIDKLLNPKLPWNTLLRRWFNDVGEAYWSWRRPNPRYPGMYLPALMPDEGLDHIVWAIDSSGSMEDWHLQEANSEIAHVHKQYTPEKMTVFSFDTQIQDTWVFGRYDRFKALEIHGRGGTSLHALWEKVKAMRPAPSALVVFTDLEVAIPPPPGKIPVLWVDLSDDGSNKPEYGSYIKIERTLDK